MSHPKAWAIDFSLVTDFASDTTGPMRLSLPSSLHLENDALVALMDMGRCCGLGLVREQALVVLPVSFQPNLLVNPYYEPKELQAEDREKLFGRDEAHLRRMLGSISIAPTAHAVTALPTNATASAGQPRYWKISPGENGCVWSDWQQRGIAAIGWDQLGDIATLSEPDFLTLAQATYNSAKRSAGPYQVWLFRMIQPGDRVIANNGRTRLLGVGTVTGGYRYEPGEDYPHQIRVQWDDTTEREIEDQPNWVRTLRELTQDKFESLVGNRETIPTAFSVTIPHNIILYGPPGTGKTYRVVRRALELLGYPNADSATSDQALAMERHRLQQAGQLVFCTFHQAFAYEEFVEGLRAETDEDGNVHYRVEPGIFKLIATTAARRREEAFVLIIDEINRANIARVFGELITLLEPDKRMGCANELRVQLPASKEWFSVPPNLHVLGTMNTADRSIALIDVALRRRFTFEEMMPDSSVIESVLASKGVAVPLRDLVVQIFDQLNLRLRYLYDREHQIGHAYFLGVRSLDDLRRVFADRILPLLQEYFFGRWDKVALALGYPLEAGGTPKEFRDDDIKQKGTLLTVSHLEEKAVLGFDHDDYVDQVDWGVHPVFRPRGTPPPSDQWLAEAFLEVVVRSSNRSQAAIALLGRLAATAQSPSAGAGVAVGLGLGLGPGVGAGAGVDASANTNAGVGMDRGAGAGGDISTGTGTPTPQVP